MQLVSFKITISVANTPVQLPDNPIQDRVTLITGGNTNTGTISIMNSPTQENPAIMDYNGETVSVKVSNTNEIWISGTAEGDVFYVIGT